MTHTKQTQQTIFFPPWVKWTLGNTLFIQLCSLFSEGCLFTSTASLYGRFSLNTHAWLHCCHILINLKWPFLLSMAMINVSPLKSKLLCANKTLKRYFILHTEIDSLSSIRSGFLKSCDSIFFHIGLTASVHVPAQSCLLQLLWDQPCFLLQREGATIRHYRTIQPTTC